MPPRPLNLTTLHKVIADPEKRDGYLATTHKAGDDVPMLISFSLTGGVEPTDGDMLALDGTKTPLLYGTKAGNQLHFKGTAEVLSLQIL